MSDFHTHLRCADEARAFIRGESCDGPACVSPMLLSYARTAQELLVGAGHDGIRETDFLIGTFASDLETERIRYLTLRVARPALVNAFTHSALPNIAGRIAESDLVDEFCDNLAEVVFGDYAVAFTRTYPELFSAAHRLLEAVRRAESAFESAGPHPARQHGPCPTCGKPWEGAVAVVPPLSSYDCRLAADFTAHCIHSLGHGPGNQLFRHDRALRATALMAE